MARNKTEKNAVIYARFSSQNQREESIEQQVDECQQYAKANGYSIVGIYSDSAVTGRTDRRPQFQKMQKDVKSGSFTHIIAYKSNRIARNILNALIFENEMEKHGVKVLYAKEEFGDNAAGRFALRTMMNVNQFYSENLAEDIKRNQIANAKECKVNGPSSFGYKTGPDGRFAIDETTAPIVREIFKRVSMGESFVDITNDFNARGLTTRRGGKWGKSSFSNILNNERYIGVYIHGDIKIKGGMPPIITEEMFYKVQERLKNKSNPQGRHREDGDYLLTGKLFCGHCGSPMIGMSGTGRSRRLHYYYSCKKLRDEHNCSKKNVKRDYLEFKIAEAIIKDVLSDDNIEWMINNILEFQKQSKNSPETLELKDKLAETDKQLKNIMTAIENGIFSETTQSRLTELEGQKAEIKSRLAILSSSIFNVSSEDLTGYFNTFKQGDLYNKDFQRALFDQFLSAVYLYDDGKLKIVFTPFDNTVQTDLNVLELECEDVRLDSEKGHQTKNRCIASVFSFVLINSGIEPEREYGVKKTVRWTVFSRMCEGFSPNKEDAKRTTIPVRVTKQKSCREIGFL